MRLLRCIKSFKATVRKAGIMGAVRARLILFEHVAMKLCSSSINLTFVVLFMMRRSNKGWRLCLSLCLLLQLRVSNSFHAPWPPSFISIDQHRNNYRPIFTTSSNADESNNHEDGRDITLQELSNTLQNLLETNHTRESLLNRRLSLPLNRCRVGPSLVPNAGRGLFATTNCSKGDLLTCYPGDVLICFDDYDTESILWGDHVEESCRLDDDTLHSTMSAYTLEVTNHRSIVAMPEINDKNNDNYDDMAYAGHFANDGAMPPQTESQISKYVLESNEVANAMHISLLDDCHMVTIATKDIDAGNEILVTYGPDYWMDHASTTTTTITTGSVIHDLQDDIIIKDANSKGKRFG